MTHRPAFAFALLACAISAPAQQISYTNPGAAVGTRLEEIDKASGTHLRVAAVIASEPVTIAVHDVPLVVFMERLAATLGAEWQTKPDGTSWLVRPADLQHKLWEEHLDVRSARIRAGNDEIIKRTKLTEAWNEDRASQVITHLADLERRRKLSPNDSYEPVEAELQSLPAGRAMAKIIRAIDVRQLAAIDADECVSFGSRPNKNIYRVPGSEAILAQWNSEQAVLAAAAERGTAIPELATGNFYNGTDWADRFATPIDQLVLVADRLGTFLGWELWALDSSDHTICKIGAFETAVYEGAPPPSLDALPDEKIELPSKIDGFVKFLEATRVATANAPTIDSEQMSWLVHPDLHDPIRFSVGYALLDIARKSGRNVIANIPDSAAGDMVALLNGKIKTRAFLSAGNAECSIRLPEGWLAIEPRDKWEAISHRLDRKALANYLRYMDETGTNSLDNEARMALASGHFRYIGFQWLYASALLPGSDSFAGGLLPTLQFYGALTPNQKQTMADGKRLSFAEISSPLRKLLDHIIFHISTSRMEAFNPPDTSGRRTEFEIPAAVGLPNGISGESTIAMAVTRKAVAFGREAVGASGHSLSPFSADIFALDRVGAETHDPNFPPPPKTLTMGYELGIDFTFEFPGPLRTVGQLRGSELDLSKPFVEYGKLPADFRAAVDNRIDYARTYFKLRHPVPEKPPPSGAPK